MPESYDHQLLQPFKRSLWCGYAKLVCCYADYLNCRTTALATHMPIAVDSALLSFTLAVLPPIPLCPFTSCLHLRVTL